MYTGDIFASFEALLSKAQYSNMVLIQLSYP